MQKRGRGTLRIIGGAWRGRRLAIPSGTGVRPTPDRVRETLFNWLGGAIVGARCLDLYAGTGALGFEALSRGAREVLFVEKDTVLADALRAHAAMLGVAPRIVRGDAVAFLEEPGSDRFDVAFVDPPYDSPLDRVLNLLPSRLSDRASVYVERRQSAGLPELRSGAWCKRSRAGAVSFGLLELAGAPAK